jgi:hypothetical protein
MKYIYFIVYLCLFFFNACLTRPLSRFAQLFQLSKVPAITFYCFFLVNIVRTQNLMHFEKLFATKPQRHKGYINGFL